MELVSVIIPAFNAAATLEETLDSASAQTWSAIEIIVVDDGSTDETADIAVRKAAGDPRIRVIRQANKGLPGARNAGMAAARGEYVAPLDADDLMHPRRIEACMARMAALGPQCGYVYTLSRGVDQAGMALDDRGQPGFEGRVYLRSLIANFVGNGSALLIRRAALEQIGGYDDRLNRLGSEDWHVQCLIARSWTVGCVPEMLTGYRMRPDGMSMNHARMRESQLRAIELILERFPETPAMAGDAARAWGLARSAALQARLLRPVRAASQFLRAARLSPMVALETLLVNEAWRLTRKAVATGLRRAGLGPATSRQHFRDIAPSQCLGGRPRASFRATMRRLQQCEAAFADS